MHLARALLFLLLLAPTAPAEEWKLVWSDEFDTPGLPDITKWDYEEGFERNQEVQYYTRGRLENARVENGLLGFDDLLLEIISQMRGERVEARDLADRYSRLSTFKRLLTELVANRDRHLVVLLDEAQQLDPASLDALKGLTNIASERQNFLTVILIGQPELRQRVRRLPQVDQRISLRYHLGALTQDEIEPYLRHRLEVAGYQGRFPFSAEAMELLHRSSRGIPREINRIGKLALEHVRNQGLGDFDEAVIATVVKDLRRHGGLFEASADAL